MRQQAVTEVKSGRFERSGKRQRWLCLPVHTGEAFEPEERFEAPDGSDIIFDTDYFGKKRKEKTVAGPFA